MRLKQTTKIIIAFLFVGFAYSGPTNRENLAQTGLISTTGSYTTTTSFVKATTSTTSHDQLGDKSSFTP